MMLATIIQDICGNSCDAGETILGVVLILACLFGGCAFLWLVFNDD